MSDLMSDPLDILVGKESCPVCGTLSQKGTVRSTHCSTYNSGIHLEERDAPSPEERASQRELDPSDYSMNPKTAIAQEEFEGDEATIKNWSGGSTDFSFVDEDSPLTQKQSIVEIPESEEIAND